MTKRIPVERYYAMLDKIDRSETSVKETAPAFLISVKHNLYISDLNRQCWRPRNGPDRKNRRT